MAGQKEDALSNLQFAVNHSLCADDRADLQKTTDLDSLRSDSRFSAILASSHQPAAPAK